MPRYAIRLGHRSLMRIVPRLSELEAKHLARNLGQAMYDFDIDTERRAAMFIAQTAHESGGFRWREELASGSAYEGRKDLGNTRPGDGRRYKGRTYIQVTGRNNYAAISDALGVDFVRRPRLLGEPKWAALGAAWWWATHGCNQLADRNDFKGVTLRINGGLNGWDDRVAYLQRARPLAEHLIPRRRKP